MLVPLFSPLVEVVAACAADDDDDELIMGIQPVVNGTSIDAAVAEMMERRDDDDVIVVVVVAVVETVVVDDSLASSVLEVATATSSDLAPLPLLLFGMPLLLENVGMGWNAALVIDIAVGTNNTAIIPVIVIIVFGLLMYDTIVDFDGVDNADNGGSEPVSRVTSQDILVESFLCVCNRLAALTRSTELSFFIELFYFLLFFHDCIIHHD